MPSGVLLLLLLAKGFANQLLVHVQQLGETVVSPSLAAGLTISDSYRGGSGESGTLVQSESLLIQYVSLANKMSMGSSA